jgi:tetratricopeptide (TPR) repeat protein
MALQKAPSSTAIRLRLASLYERKSEWQNAEHEYQQVIDISKPHGSVYADRSRVREKLNKIEDSISDLDRAIELQPGANRFLLMRSRLNLRSGREAQAKADYQMAMRLSPNTTDDWISRALAQLPRYPERALADLRAAQAIEPFRFEVLQNIAHVLSEHLHENVKALEPLEQLIARRPFNEMARAGRCVLLAREGFVDKALQDIDFLMDSPSGVEPATLYQIGCAYALISNHHPPSRERAIEYLARAIMRGYGADLLENDPDLSHVQNAPEFLSLVTVCRLVQDQTASSTLEHEDKKPHANDSSPPKQSKP